MSGEIVMVHQVTLEEAVGHLPELVREANNGQEIVLFQNHRPVAKLVSLTDDIPSREIAALAMSGGAFNWLADEPELYDDTCGETIH
jgi:antitoxin (DNA-binding transcriptional repressor) of toxin-antitoxin stability system